MFISGGENVYPAEVEAVIADCPGVALAAVVGIPDVRWGEVGVAYIEGRPGHDIGSDAIRGFLAGRLAKFKQPHRNEVEATLPRTGSGKIDKPELIRRAVGAS
jgi:fatty-acyl-CoA synthase